MLLAPSKALCVFPLLFLLESICCSSMFPNLPKVVEHLHIRWLENPSFLKRDLIFSIKCRCLNFFGEHFETVQEAVVVLEQWLGTTAVIKYLAPCPLMRALLGFHSQVSKSSTWEKVGFQVPPRQSRTNLEFAPS